MVRRVAIARLHPRNWPLVGRFFGRSGWVRGRYVSGFEVSSFEPAGSSERWWTSFDESVMAEANELMTASTGDYVEVELSGEKSDKGEYGHMGMYERAFHVRAIRRK